MITNIINIINIIIIGSEGSRLITDDEKMAIKTFLLDSSFEETNMKVVLQMALLAAKVILLLLLLLENIINIIRLHQKNGPSDGLMYSIYYLKRVTTTRAIMMF